MRKLIGFITAGVLLISVGCDKPSVPSTDERASTTGEATSIESEAVVPSQAKAARSANADHYDVRSAQSAVEVGKKAKIEFAITPSDGLKINKEFPWKLEFSDVPNVQLAQKTIAAGQFDLDESEATFPVMLEASAAGVHTLEATGDFSVCNDTKCYSIRGEALKFSVKAKGAAQDGASQDGASQDGASQDGAAEGEAGDRR